MSEVADLLKKTLEALGEAEIPSDLKPIAFAKAFDCLAGSSPVAPSGSLPPKPDKLAGDGPLSAIAARLEVPVDLVERIYEFTSAGELQLIVSAKSLDPAKSKATQEIAALVSFGRQAAGLDESNWTPIDEVRAVCQEYNRYDEGNFASSIRSIDEIFGANVKGTGRNRQIRMTRESWPRVAALVRRLTDATDA